MGNEQANTSTTINNQLNESITNILNEQNTSITNSADCKASSNQRMTFEGEFTLPPPGYPACNVTWQQKSKTTLHCFMNAGTSLKTDMGNKLVTELKNSAKTKVDQAAKGIAGATPANVSKTVNNIHNYLEENVVNTVNTTIDNALKADASDSQNMIIRGKFPCSGNFTFDQSSVLGAIAKNSSDTMTDAIMKLDGVKELSAASDTSVKQKSTGLAAGAIDSVTGLIGGLLSGPFLIVAAIVIIIIVIVVFMSMGGKGGGQKMMAQMAKGTPMGAAAGMMGSMGSMAKGTPMGAAAGMMGSMGSMASAPMRPQAPPPMNMGMNIGQQTQSAQQAMMAAQQSMGGIQGMMNRGMGMARSMPPGMASGMMNRGMGMARSMPPGMGAAGMKMMMRGGNGFQLNTAHKLIANQLKGGKVIRG